MVATLAPFQPFVFIEFPHLSSHCIIRSSLGARHRNCKAKLKDADFTGGNDCITQIGVHKQPVPISVRRGNGDFTGKKSGMDQKN